MKKVLPFVFPALAVLIILFLGYRWYNLRTARTPEISKFGEGVEIEDLTAAEQDSVRRGVGDFKSVTLRGEGETLGTVRYEIKDGKVRFSVTAMLPELTAGQYQVWLKQVGGEGIKPAFVLEDSKSGYMGSAAIDESSLPFEIVVSKEQRPDSTMEEVLLRGTIEKPQ
jgi:hypothetical protein